MASRRLLDLLAVIDASSAVARRRYLIRSQQFGVYTSGSSIFASFRGRPHNNSPRHTGPSNEAPSSTQPASTAAHTIPDLTSPGASPGELRNPLEPSAPPVATRPPARDGAPSQQDTPAEELTPGINDATFYLRHARASPALSGMPRMKIQRQTGPGHEGGTENGSINSGVFFTKTEVGALGAGAGSGQHDGGIGGEFGSELFRSKRGRALFAQNGETIREQGPVGAVDKVDGGTESTDMAARDMGNSGERNPLNPDANRAPEDTMLKVETETKELDTSTPKNVTNSSVVVIEQSPESPSFQMAASRVPASRLGRLFHYGGLAAGMAWGAAGETVRRATWGRGSGTTGGVMLNPANVERLVRKLGKMRGAALKLGQMMSFQDSKILPPPVHEAFTRVQDSADYMPPNQRDSVLSSNLGPSWRDLFSDFSELPMAAASIGQVHAATLASSGLPVAVKIQYPGVATSISSDLNNLAVLLTASRLLPRGLYLDKAIANARIELGWECDYVREAECAKRFAELLKDDHVFRVPRIVDEACGPQVLTMERMWGVGATKLMGKLTQKDRDFIGTELFRLCIREFKEFRFMQTDPNWTNFLWNAEDKKIELLDFGASRDFPAHFVDTYCSLLRAGARADRASILAHSLTIGYLTGHESRAMLDAHTSSILTLAEPFSVTAPQVYDFADQTITSRVRDLIPLMIKERLTPPPEENYSLHRKLSGAFLLCARLGSRVRCREVFERVVGIED